MDISAWEGFNMGTFWHEEFSAQEIFRTGKIWHGDISAHGDFCTVAEVPKCQSILLCKVPKYPGAKMFRYQNIPCLNFYGAEISRAEKSPCRNIPVLKSASTRKYTGPRGAHAEMFL